MRYRSVPGLAPVTLHTNIHTYTHPHTHIQVLESRWRPQDHRNLPIVGIVPTGPRSSPQYSSTSNLPTYLTCPPKPQAQAQAQAPRSQVPGPPAGERAQLEPKLPLPPCSLLPASQLPSLPKITSLELFVPAFAPAPPFHTVPVDPRVPKAPRSQGPRSKVPKVEAEAAVALRATCLLPCFLPSRVPISTRTLRLLTLLHLHSTSTSTSTCTTLPLPPPLVLLLLPNTHCFDHPPDGPFLRYLDQRLLSGSTIHVILRVFAFLFFFPPRPTHAGTQARRRIQRTKSLCLTSSSHCVCCLPALFRALDATSTSPPSGPYLVSTSLTAPVHPRLVKTPQ